MMSYKPMSRKQLSPKQALPGVGSGTAILLGLLGLMVVIGLWFMGTYNGLINKDAEVERQASNVESQLKRRADLIPNLVATVKGYAKHEKGVYDNIAAARSRLLSADVNSNPREAAAANSAFNSSLGRLLAIAENYPQLKADQNFIRLQDELTGTENRINVARLSFNDAVKDYNIAVRAFPGNVVAGISGFSRKESFEATEAEKSLPKVDFE